MKRLEKIIKGIDIKCCKGASVDGVEVTNVISDSRQASEGVLFVAVKGTINDGHKYISGVIQSGARVIVCEDIPEQIVEGVAYIQVVNSAIALGQLASAWYDYPSDKLKLVGVTGTNGKTTIATLLYDLVRLLGYKAGLLSTVCNYVDSKAIPATQTTPDPLTINQLMNEMVEAGCDYAFMEVSSHAVDQHRIAGLNFIGGLFTNLTRDHMDYHKTVDNYLKAKKGFFDGLGKSAFAVVNVDDKAGMVMLQNCAAKGYKYSLRSMADYRARILERRLNGTLVEINGVEIELAFTGVFNVYNLLTVYAAATLMGLDSDEVLVKMSLLHPVAGRFQTILSPRGYTAIVDYAHTPDAVINVLEAIKDVIGEDGKIITVVGAGGNRDKGKRPIMAKEAALRSDKLVLTSDNPRFESPEEILADMVEGLDATLRAKTMRITDRAEAIKVATQLANAGDVILVAGKGHEDYQEICGVKHHFDDTQVIKNIIKEEII
ncbi:MAG: UDP-N-acetylmuramoyl-L-alanyl-D-glutamate--2,6-diaminopimelate ligase [Bacteroidales bacterium]